jgi:predicted ribosomally synthesized peptide with SipW-like signal peptide
MIIDRQKKKLAAGAVAGVAALALIGGGTFALWSDFDVLEDNTASAGRLQLTVENGPVNNVGQPLAPGENYDYEYFLSSADLAGVPDADLSLTITGLENEENGCNGAEAEDDPTCGTDEADGEFSEQSVMRIRWTAPIANATAATCKNGAQTFDRGVQVLNTAPSIDEVVAAGPIALGTLTKGQGVCVRIDVGLPPAASNATQGDAATYDVQFDLQQTTPRFG